MLCTSYPSASVNSNTHNVNNNSMSSNFQPIGFMASSNSNKSRSSPGPMGPPPMPSGVSFGERATSMPANTARSAPTEPRSVSFSDSVTYNFPVPASPGSFPGRIVSQVTRKSSLESIGEFDLSFSSLNEEDLVKGPKVDPLFEPNKIFDSKLSDAFNNCSEDDLRTALHRACQQFPRRKAMIKNALKRDPSAVRRRAFVPGRANKSGVFPPEPYQLPINIALAHKASLDVLDVLVKADPTQLTQKDGIHGANSLCLALEKRPNDIAVLGMFLVSNPQLIKSTCDNSNNTPLHVACQRGSSLPIIRQLFRMYPAALFHCNESGKSPIDILQQQAQVCPKAKTSLEYLQEKALLLQQQQQQQHQTNKRQS